MFNVNGMNITIGSEVYFIANALAANKYKKIRQKRNLCVYAGEVQRIAYEPDYKAPRDEPDRFIFYVDVLIDNSEKVEKLELAPGQWFTYMFENVREDNIFPDAESAQKALGAQLEAAV